MSDLPRYQCHKKVMAMKIKSVNGGEIELNNDAIIQVDESFLEKHNPTPGAYYVIYGDGYVSISPSDAFEAGYDRL